MAELTQKQIDDFITLADTLAKKNPEIAAGLKNLSGSLTAQKRAVDLNVRDLYKQQDALKNFNSQMKLLSGPGDGGLARMVKGFKEGDRVVQEYKETLRDLDEQIENTSEGHRKNVLEQQREVMARRVATTSMKQAALDFTTTVGKQAVNQIAQTTGTFVRGLQGNTSATELSQQILTGAVDLASSSAQSAGSAMSKAGDTIAGVGKHPGIKAVGVGMSLLGIATSKAAEATGKLAKFGIEVLSKEVEKTVNAFNLTSRAGAMFADGMTGMRQAARGAGLTVEQFSKVVSENSGLLAASGMGVGEASRRMGAVSTELDKTVGSSGKNLRREMMQLGYSYEEQAGLIAETMADLRIGRSRMMGDDKAIAEQTAQYASSLRTISALTGEDAKRKMDEQRAASTQVAFRLKLQELEQKQPGITQKLQASMLTMDATSKKALMEQMTIGTVVDKAANVMMAGSSAFGDKISGMAELAESGSFTTEKAQQIQAEANDKMQADLANFREIGVAGMTGALGDLNAAISGQIANMDKITVDAVTSSQRLVEQQKATNDKLTTGVTAAADAAQKLKVALEDTLTEAVNNYAMFTADILSTLQTKLAEIGFGGEKKERSWADKLTDAGTSGAAGAATGATLGMFLGPKGALAGALIGGTIGAIKGWFSNNEGKAIGGIAEGPKSGYIEKLHGTEAVIPLPENRSIPVEIKQPSMPSGTNFALPGFREIGMALNSVVGTVGNLVKNSDSQTTVLEENRAQPTVMEGISSALSSLGSIASSPGKLAMMAGDKLESLMNTSVVNSSNSKFDLDKATNTSGFREIGEQTAIMRDHINLLTDIRELLNSSVSLQQQYVYNTYK